MERRKWKKTMAFELCVADAYNSHIYEYSRFIKQNKVLQRIDILGQDLNRIVYEPHAQF